MLWLKKRKNEKEQQRNEGVSIYFTIYCCISVLHLLLHLILSHEILLDRPSQRCGITESVQEWFASYLSSRTQFVQIECSRSLRELSCGVPQGSVLRPLLYVLYTQPVADIIETQSYAPSLCVFSSMCHLN